MNTATTRLEHDLLGDKEVPTAAYYGVHTLRALENFPITGITIAVYPDLIRARGRLGRSQGCPALREGIARVVIDAMKQRQLLFAYADDAAWLQRGRSFACDGRDARTILAAARGDAAQGGGAIGAISAP